MKTYRILICRLAPLENMGVVATLMGLIKSLRSYMPDVEITVFSYLPSKYENLEHLGIKLCQYPWWRAWGRMWPISPAILIPYDFIRCSLFRLLGRFNKNIKTPYEQYDVVIDNNTEHLKEDLYGTRFVTTSLLLTFLAWAVFRRPLATTPTSAGPLTTRLNKWLARHALNRVDLLALREEANYTYCRQLGINKPLIRFVSDPGFLLKPVSPERVDLILQQEGIPKGDKPFIGFSPNWFEMERFSFGDSVSGSEREEKYVQLMAEVIDYLVDRLDATVCLIPHVVGSLFSGEQNNDRAVCYRIFDKVINKHAVTILRGEYMPDELKGIIGICDMFIGGRMHATIAATSLGVPTIAIAYGDKYYHIIGDTMGQEEYIVDVRKPSYDALLSELKSKIDVLWENRDKVRGTLKERAEIAEQVSLSYGRLIQELAEKSKVL